jgi:hypothetical protein
MSDAQLIDRLGGPSRVAERLNLLEKGAVQRVSNWKRRGIPARVRLENPALFGDDEEGGAPAVPEVQPATQET